MTNVFTIVSCNYLAEARVLMDSVREFLPEARRTVFFIDDWKGKFDPAKEEFECVAAWATAMPRYRHFAFAYSPGEFCFALKPFCARHLFDRSDVDQLIYVDSDMLFLAHPAALLETLNRHPIVLTPHKLRAAESTEHFNIVRAGAFNAGFFALSRSVQADDFIAWWGRQMIEPGNLAQDWFFDQGWLDLVPSYFPDTAILRHAGYNVAFWNLLERRLARGAARATLGGKVEKLEGEKSGGSACAFAATNDSRLCDSTAGQAGVTSSWRVWFGGEEVELVLYHFSLFDHRHPDRMTGEVDYARIRPSADVDALIAQYVARLKKRGLEECHQWPYDHGRFADGKAVSKEHREFFKRRVFPELATEKNPFDPVMQSKTLGSLYNVDHPLARLVRSMRGTVK
jgi:hypothetical protein